MIDTYILDNHYCASQALVIVEPFVSFLPIVFVLVLKSLQTIVLHIYQTGFVSVFLKGMFCFNITVKLFFFVLFLL
jgi:high-affinity K+ transport system ATPase subunit B